jgi:hypothetical protein
MPTHRKRAPSAVLAADERATFDMLGERLKAQLCRIITGAKWAMADGAPVQDVADRIRCGCVDIIVPEACLVSLPLACDELVLRAVAMAADRREQQQARVSSLEEVLAKRKRSAGCPGGDR